MMELFARDNRWDADTCTRRTDPLRVRHQHRDTITWALRKEHTTARWRIIDR